MSLSLLAMISTNGAPEVVDKVRLALEDSSAGWFRLVKYAGYAVAVGCAMEAPETSIIIKRWWRLRFCNIDHDETQEDRRHWAVPLAALGLLIIVAGIVVETFGESKVSDVDAMLRAHESDQITSAEDEAASAIRDAGTAKASSKGAAVAAGTAQTSAATAGKQAVLAGAQARAVGAEADHLATKLAAQQERADEAARSLEEEKNRRLLLAVSMLPRNFSDQSGAITRLSGSRPITVRFEYVGEEEPKATAKQIAFVLKFLHWPFSDIPAEDKHDDLIREGITISVGLDRPPDLPLDAFRRQREETIAFGEKLRDVLNSSGLETRLGPTASDQFVPSGELLVSVGRKANHFLEQSLIELGPPQTTPLGGTNGATMGDNRVSIPEARP